MERPGAAFLEFCNATKGLDRLPQAEQIHRLKQALHRTLARAVDAVEKQHASEQLADSLRSERESEVWSAGVASHMRSRLAEQGNELAKARAQLRATEAVNRTLTAHCRNFAIVMEEDLVAVQALDRVLERKGS